jgi:transposase-like protein
MRQQTRSSKEPAEKVVQDIRRATRKHYSAEEKIRIVLEGLRGEDIGEGCGADLAQRRQADIGQTEARPDEREASDKIGLKTGLLD